MIQTLEAVVDKTGKIRLLEDIVLDENRRALVTILDEKPKVPLISKKENLRAVFGKMQDLEMFRNTQDISKWQKNLRDEWG